MDGINSKLNALTRINDEAIRQIAETNRLKTLPGQIAEASTSVEVCKLLKSVFQAFEHSINPDEEIALALSSFGVQHQIVVDSVAALGVNLIVIRGIEGGVSVSLVQHLNQLSFLLVPVKKAQPDAPRRKIGFTSE